MTSSVSPELIAIWLLTWDGQCCRREVSSSHYQVPISFGVGRTDIKATSTQKPQLHHIRPQSPPLFASYLLPITALRRLSFRATSGSPVPSCIARHIEVLINDYILHAQILFGPDRCLRRPRFTHLSTGRV